MNKHTFLSYLRTAITLILLILTNALVIIGMTYLCGDFTIGKWYNAFIIVIAMTIVNTILWPIFQKFFMKFMVVTLGIGSLFINAIILYIACYFIPNVNIGFYASVEVPIVMSIAITFIANITHTSYYDRYIKTILQYVTKQKKDGKKYPGIIMLEIDGLSINILKKAIDKGIMPTVEKWIGENTHTLKEWETDLSSQTGASQAGILHGNNENIVAYRWVEKENDNQIIVSGKLSHAPLIEKRISDGKGLLVDGISVSNMFSGDGKNAPLTSSRLGNISRINNKTLHTIFLNSYNFQRIFVLFLWDILMELKSQLMHFIKNIQPRLRRTIVYAAVRAGANVVLREVTTQILAAEILNGEIDTAYATFMGYDEIAHHSGTQDEDVWPTLNKIDLQFQRLVSTINMSERDYYLVILSDHGQSNGATFKQRYGITLGNYVRRLLPDDLTFYSEEYNIDHFRDAILPENRQLKNIKERVGTFREDILDDNSYIQSIRDEIENRKPEIIFENEKYQNIRQKYSDSLDYIRRHEITEQSTKKAKDSELIVLGSGNLGLIYLTKWKQRLTYEELVMLFPELIPGLVKHPGIGFILVNSITNGGMVIGENGIYYLETDVVTGENPLSNYGKNAVKHLKRENSFKNMPDLMVNSFYDKKSDEVCAFEELIGSHGGLGGDQTKPFILYPSQWEDPGELIGASSIYKFLKKEIDELKS